MKGIRKIQVLFLAVMMCFSMSVMAAGAEKEGTPSAEELADGYFRVIAGIEQGTAGAMLKQAEGAAEAAVFAADHELWDPDIDAVRANLLEAWESLAPEEQSAFDANFMGVVDLINTCLEDWESQEGVFDDAGVKEQMEMIVFDPLNRLAWENLSSYTFTLGNDDGEVTEMQEKGEDGLFASLQFVSETPEWIAALPAAQDENVTQLFVVAGLGMDKTTAFISMHQRGEDGQWEQILSTPGFVGKNGLCLDEDHAEGCGQTPIGVYHFNKAFGITTDPGCAIPYVQVDEDTYWSGDEKEHYNEMVDIKDYPELDMTNSEHIVDYGYEYQYCLNISFNEEGTPGRGSAIFLHCFGTKKPYTGGCVAIPENIMKLVMQTVQEDCVVVIDTLENMGGGF